MTSNSVTAARLSVLDRFLPIWIFGAMGIGIAIGRVSPRLAVLLDTVKIAGVSLPIALGLFWMMYPVLAKVRYGRLAAISSNTKLFTASLVFNWILGPLLMFVLAFLLLP